MAMGAGIDGAGGQADTGLNRKSGFNAEAVNIGTSKGYPSGKSSMEVPGNGDVVAEDSQKQMRHYDQCACRAAEAIDSWVKPE